MIAFLKKSDEILGKTESFLLILLITFLILFSSAEIVLRIFFNTGFVWIAPSMRIFVLWLAFAGGSKAIQAGAYIKIDLASKMFYGSMPRYLDKMIFFCSSLILSYLSVISAIFLFEEKKYGEIFMPGIMYWHVEIIYPLGFFAAAFHFLVKLIDKQKIRD